MNVSTEMKIIDLENRLVTAKGERKGVAGFGSLGLTDEYYCSWNGFTMRSFCAELRTMSRYFATQQWEENLCIHVCEIWPPCCTVEKIKKKETKAPIVN